MRKLPTIRHEVLYGNRVVKCFTDRPKNIDAMFREVAIRFPDRIAVTEGDSQTSYRELENQIQIMAVGLLSLGYCKGERIALLMGNEGEFIVAFLAATRIGLISVPMNTRQRMPEIEHVLNQNQTSAMIVDAAFVENVPPRNEVPSLRGVFILGEGATYPDASTYASISAAAPDDIVFPEIHQEDTLCLLYTSGTTGKPKGAMLTHVSSIHSLMHYAWGFQLNEGDVAFLSVPASHVTGLIAIILTSFYVGGRVVIEREFKARRFLELAEKEGINYSLMVPAMYNLCLLDKNFANYDLASWRVAGFGGAPMPQATTEKLTKYLPNLVLHNVYGSTETTSPVTLLPAGAIHDHSDTVGKVLPLANIIVVDENLCEVRPGQSGELLISGPMVVPGYWENPESNAKEFLNGYWVSGDIGSKDLNDFVRVFDRKKDMINRAGFKIYCIEVENVLARYPAVIEAAVVAHPDEVLGERVHAFLYCESTEVSEDDIKSYCSERLSDYKVPEIVTILDRPLARNANGKVLKNVLRDMSVA
jgi:acyl-CoA synthetase (AMP-forming)/AMP-acid ligase II